MIARLTQGEQIETRDQGINRVLVFLVGPLKKAGSH
jgi:hypothetical protein